MRFCIVCVLESVRFPAGGDRAFPLSLQSSRGFRLVMNGTAHRRHGTDDTDGILADFFGQFMIGQDASFTQRGSAGAHRRERQFLERREAISSSVHLQFPMICSQCGSWRRTPPFWMGTAGAANRGIASGRRPQLGAPVCVQELRAGWLFHSVLLTAKGGMSEMCGVLNRSITAESLFANDHETFFQHHRPISEFQGRMTCRSRTSAVARLRGLARYSIEWL